MAIPDPERPAGPRDALRNPAFRRWFLAQAFSASGSTTQLIGLSWLVTHATGSGLALGMLTVAIFTPVLVLGPIVGHLVDRYARRRLLLLTQSAFAVIGAGLAIATAVDGASLPILYASAVLTGLVNAIDGPARQVFLMELVGPRLIPASIGLYEVVINVSRVLGPGVAGLLLATWGVVPCFVFNALTALPALVVLLTIRSLAVPPVASGSVPRLLDGFRWVARRPDITWTLAIAVAAGMLFNLSVVVPLMAHRVFGVGGGAYGLFVAVFGLGALVGATRAASRITHPRFREHMILAAVTGGIVVVTALAPAPWMFAIGLGATGAIAIWCIARANAFVQLQAPASIRGRVMTVWNMALPGMNPVTGFIAGATADLVSTRAAFALPGVFFVVIVGAAVLQRSYVRRTRQS